MKLLRNEMTLDTNYSFTIKLFDTFDLKFFKFIANKFQ